MNTDCFWPPADLMQGVAICFYGYDQGVMSMVNLNPDYQKLMGIFPLEGTLPMPWDTGHTLMQG